MKLGSGTVTVVLNHKGGVGKTHTVWTLAGGAVNQGRKMLLVDCDEQANLTKSFLNDRGKTFGVEALLNPAEEPKIEGLVRKTKWEGIEIVPASGNLSRVNLSNQREWEKNDLQFSLIEPLNRLRGKYDHVILDCPPNLSLISMAALCAADFVLVPLEAADWGAQGIMNVKGATEYVQKRFNGKLKLLGYLVSRFKKARAYQQTYLQELRSRFGEDTFDTVVPDLAHFEKSVIDRIPITVHSPRSPAAAICRELFQEFEARIQMQSGKTLLNRLETPLR